MQPSLKESKKFREINWIKKKNLKIKQCNAEGCGIENLIIQDKRSLSGKF